MAASQPLDRNRRCFVLYVEGPRDHDLLATWAARVSPRLSESMIGTAVILGGRQPHRALDHFRSLRDQVDVARGLCVLDRDGGDLPDAFSAEPGLDFFIWSRRHIESYLLVPDAIRRTLRASAEKRRVERVLRDELPTHDDETAYQQIDAKRLLAKEGLLARAAGRPIAPRRIARAMHQGEFHSDIREVLKRIESAHLALEEEIQS